MNTRVRHALQPRSDMGVRGGHIELETGLRQSRCERHQEARLEVAVEALDLAFSLGSVRPAQPWPKAKLLSHGQKIPMEAMLADTIGVALDDHGGRVIKEHVRRDPAEVDERLAQARAQGRRILRDREAHEARTAVA